ncbi:MAG: hypothetical protein WC707_02465 [Candidatus Babeliaceae bacterium]|jgi:hypothetical protein
MKLLSSVLMTVLFAVPCFAVENYEFEDVVELAERQARSIDALLHNVIAKVAVSDVVHDCAKCHLAMMRTVLTDVFENVRDEYDEKSLFYFVNCAYCVVEAVAKSVDGRGTLFVESLENVRIDGTGVMTLPIAYDMLMYINRRVELVNDSVNQQPNMLARYFSDARNVLHDYHVDAVVKRALPYAAAFTYWIYIKTDEDVEKISIPGLKTTAKKIRSVIGGVKNKEFPKPSDDESAVIVALGKKKTKFNDGLIATPLKYAEGIVKIDFEDTLFKISPMTLLLPFIKRDVQDIYAYCGKLVAKKDSAMHCSGVCHFPAKKLSYTQRLSLIQELLKNTKKMHDDVLCDYIAGATSGLTELDIYTLLKDAAQLAQASHEPFSKDHVEKIINRTVRHLSGCKSDISQEDIIFLASACAGELLACEAAGKKVIWAGIDDTTYKIFTYNEHDEQKVVTRDMLFAQCKIACAASVAQELVIRTYSYDVLQKGKQRAFDIAFAIACNGASVDSLTKKMKEEKMREAWDIVSICSQEIKTFLQKNIEKLQQLSVDITFGNYSVN